MRPTARTLSFRRPHAHLTGSMTVLTNILIGDLIRLRRATVIALIFIQIVVSRVSSPNTFRTHRHRRAHQTILRTSQFQYIIRISGRYGSSPAPWFSTAMEVGDLLRYSILQLVRMRSIWEVLVGHWTRKDEFPLHEKGRVRDRLDSKLLNLLARGRFVNYMLKLKGFWTIGSRALWEIVRLWAVYELLLRITVLDSFTAEY